MGEALQAVKIVDALLDDLRHRRGLANELDMIDEDIYQDMRDELISVVTKILADGS